MSVSEPIGLKTLRITRRRALGTGAGLAGALALSGTFRPGIASAQDDIELTIDSNHPEWNDFMREILDAFEAANPGIKIELNAVPGPDYPVKLNTDIAAGVTADILGLEDGSIIGKFLPEGGELPFIDLTGKIDLSGLTDVARAAVSADGKDYGTPLAAYTVGLAVNNPVFAEAGVALPTTWDELKAASEALKAKDVTPIVLGGKDAVHPFFMYIGLVSSILGPEGIEQLRSGERKLTDPDLLPAAQMLIDMMPYYNEGFTATDYITAKSIFANGLGAMMVAGTADFAGYKQVNPEADLTFIPWPGPEAGKSATTTGLELLYTVSANSSPEKQEAATKFVNWLATTEAQQLVSDKIALPINRNVAGSTDPNRAQTVEAAAKGDVPVWYDVPELGATFAAVDLAHGALFAEKDALAFAQAVQDSIKPSGA